MNISQGKIGTGVRLHEDSLPIITERSERGDKINVELPSISIDGVFCVCIQIDRQRDRQMDRWIDK